MLYCTAIEGIFGGRSLVIIPKYCEKQVDARAHPCPSPPAMGNVSEKAVQLQTILTIPS